ncbi:hypothetical protein U9M48_040613 [Paspalum notatum var. saurae]|uniref:Ubiquitin-like domain-containing protein n=1 Tax=Paspalum notatum var. saurae TaxID=547442 RepID=A0AAQ3XEE4_PASNO
MGTITCELEASYVAGTAGDDDKGTTIPHQQCRRLTFFAGNTKGKGRRLGDGGGGGTLAAGSWPWCSSMFLCRRANASINMQVFVRTLAGKSLALDVSPNDTVDAVKAMIQAKERIAAAEQPLVFAGRDLDDSGRTLADYGVRKEANLFLHLRLRGGAGGDVSAGGSHSHHSWSTAVGLLATVVAVAAALPYLPAAAEEDSGSLTLAFLLVVWAIAVGGVNLITVGASGKTSSGGARSALSRRLGILRRLDGRCGDHDQRCRPCTLFRLLRSLPGRHVSDLVPRLRGREAPQQQRRPQDQWWSYIHSRRRYGYLYLSQGNSRWSPRRGEHDRGRRLPDPDRQRRRRVSQLHRAQKGVRFCLSEPRRLLGINPARVCTLLGVCVWRDARVCARASSMAARVRATPRCACVALIVG